MIIKKILYVIIILANLLFITFYSNYFPVLLLIVITVLPLTTYIIMLMVIKMINIEFKEYKKFYNKNEKVSLKLVVSNKSIFPISKVDIEIIYEDSFNNRLSKVVRVSINSHDTKEIVCSLNCKCCGVIKGKINNVIIYDYLSMFSKKKIVNNNISLVVLPHIHIFNKEVYRECELLGYNNKFSQLKSGDDPSEIFNIRGYIPGDKIQRVHWKLSSKYDDLMIKELSLPLEKSACIIIELFVKEDSKRSAELIDALMEVSFSLSNYLVEIGYVHSLVWYDYVKKQLNKREIIRAEDLKNTLAEILQAKIYSDFSYAITYNNRLQSSNNSSRVIYLSTNIDKVVNAELKVSRCENNIKTILIGDLIGNQISSDIDLFIDINNLEEGFDKLII